MPFTLMRDLSAQQDRKKLNEILMKLAQQQAEQGNYQPGDINRITRDPRTGLLVLPTSRDVPVSGPTLTGQPLPMQQEPISFTAPRSKKPNILYKMNQETGQFTPVEVPEGVTKESVVNFNPPNPASKETPQERAARATIENWQKATKDGTMTEELQNSAQSAADFLGLSMDEIPTEIPPSGWATFWASVTGKPAPKPTAGTPTKYIKFGPGSVGREADIEQQARDELTKAGYEATPANLKEAIRQLKSKRK